MRFSIILPVLNEEAILEEQLAHLTRLRARHDCELIVVDGGSQDATASIARRYAKVIALQRGRAVQMNAGAKIATGDVLIFLHADTRLPDDVFVAIEKALLAPEVVGGAFRVCFNCDRWPYRIVAFSINLRSQLRASFTGDQAYFMRAASFHAAGGYPDQPLMEDLEIISRLRRFGKVVLLPQYVITSARRHEKLGLLRSILFMWYLRTLYKFGVSPAQLQRMYIDIR